MKRAICRVAAGLALVAASSGANADNEIAETGHQVKHVLLISVDGLHALDLTNYVDTHGDSTLAALSRQGITYTNNSTSTPSDSFPGLASLVTGGSPTTTGLWYDDTYNRALSPPCNGRLRQSGRSLPWHRGYQRCVGRGSRHRSHASWTVAAVSILITWFATRKLAARSSCRTTTYA